MSHRNEGGSRFKKTGHRVLGCGGGGGDGGGGGGKVRGVVLGLGFRRGQTSRGVQ